jgi:hypothetical protein
MTEASTQVSRQQAAQMRRTSSMGETIAEPEGGRPVRLRHGGPRTPTGPTPDRWSPRLAHAAASSISASPDDHSGHPHPLCNTVHLLHVRFCHGRIY